MISNKNALKVYGIFFKRYQTLKEASMIYNPNMPKKARNERVVQYWFKKFQKENLLEGRKEKRRCIRTSKLGKKTKIDYPVTTYKANCNFLLSGKHVSSKLKDFLSFFLDRNFVRSYLIESYVDNIPLGVEDILKQLLLTSITIKQYGLNRRSNNFLNISDITLDNYELVLKERIDKYYKYIIYRDITKNKIKTPKFKSAIRKLLPKNSFWTFFNLFALVMLKLFFKDGFITELVKTSPKLHFWLGKIYGDFSFIS